ncbi:MAG TPA: BatA domain-containing protein [Pyrinomonadaceae bacterium]|jgi:hypothetical protein
MSFLSPLALIGLALVSLPVIIHLLSRRRAEKLDFPTLRYLRETQSFRLRPRRIRQPLLLALRVLALLLLILGIARPLFTLRSQSQPTRLIIIDASLSMRSQNRAAAAREEARAIINKLAQDERAAVISLSSEPLVLAATTANRQELLAAVEQYEPGSSAVDFNKGFTITTALLEREAPGRAEIELISDFQQTNLVALTEQPSKPPALVRTHPVGASLERNAFLLDEAVWKNETGIQLFASEIVSAADGRSGVRRIWMINANAGEQPDIVWRTESNGQLTGRIRTLAPDDFEPDDERFFAFAAPRDTRVLLIESNTETDLYLGAALEAAASTANRSSPPLTRQRQLPKSADELNSYALVAFTLHGTLRADELRLLSEYARGGGTIWLSLARDADVPALNALAATDDGSVLPFKSLSRLSSERSWNIGSADLSALPLRSITDNTLRALQAVNVREGYAFDQRAGTETLMRWSNGTAAFISTRLGGGRVLLLGASVESAASDLGRSPAFPSLAHSILRAAVAPREPLSYNLGEPVDLGLAPEASLTMTDAAGRNKQLKARDLMQRPLSVLKEAGIYRVESERSVRFVALNAPAAESERSLINAAEVQHYFNVGEPVATVGGNEWREAVERGGNDWRYFLYAAFLLLVGELFVSVRRRWKRNAAAEIVNPL